MEDSYNYRDDQVDDNLVQNYNPGDEVVVPDEDGEYIRAIITKQAANGYYLILCENCEEHLVPKHLVEPYIPMPEDEYVCEICDSAKIRNAETFLKHAIGRRHMKKVKQIKGLLTRFKIDPYTERVDLHNRFLTNQDANDIGHWLANDPPLTDLNLSWNRIADVGGRELGAGLESNDTLVKLNLYDNCMTDLGAKHLGDGLKNNSTLTWLHLGCNKIAHAGAYGLAQGLKINAGLRRLYLYDNEIGNEGACCLADALTERRKRLDKLLIWRNKLDTEGIDALEYVKTVHPKFELYLKESREAFR